VRFITETAAYLALMAFVGIVLFIGLVGAL